MSGKHYAAKRQHTAKAVPVSQDRGLAEVVEGLLRVLRGRGGDWLAGSRRAGHGGITNGRR